MCKFSPVFLLLLITSSATKADLNEPLEIDIPEDYENDSRVFGSRSTQHIQKMFYTGVKKGSDETNTAHWYMGANDEEMTDSKGEDTLKKLVKIYKSNIKRLEDAYHFQDISALALTDSELFAVPRVLFIGPWSTGKSSLINYFLGIENTSFALPSGAQPTTSDFTILTHGDSYKTVKGSVLVMDSKYSSLAKFGQKFLDRLENVQIPSEILKKVNFIDTPGILENRKQQERGYPFSQVCQWFIDRADLIVLVFDPNKLDVGMELELLFRQIKEHEAKVRSVLNKADGFSSQELLRVYGSLFWNLAPHINTTEPPKVYIGSFWSKQYRPISKIFHGLFLSDEMSLLHDISALACSRVQNKIAYLRKYALKVRNHALVVDQYLHALNEHTSFFHNADEVAMSVVHEPDFYKVFQRALAYPDVSKLDLYPQLAYKDFFSVHRIDSFLPLSKHCGYIRSCLLDLVNYDIYHTIPSLLERYEAASEQICVTTLSYQGNSIDLSSEALHAHDSDEVNLRED